MSNLDQNFWAKYFKYYDLLNELIPYRETLELMISKIPPGYKNIIDMGCGTGNLIKLLSDSRNDVIITGIDYSDQALNIAKNKLINRDKIFFLKVDLREKLPFKDGEFDVVLIHNVLYTIDESYRPGFIKEIFRLLKDGGVVITCNLNKDFKPYNIYNYHIKRSIKKNGLIRTMFEIFKYIYPTIKIFYYNKLIKRENSSGGYKFFDKGEQGDLFKEVGFLVEEEDVLAYAKSSYLTVLIK